MAELKTRIMTISDINKINEGGEVIVRDTVDLSDLDWYVISSRRLTEKALIEFKEYIDWEVLFDHGKTPIKDMSLETCKILADYFVTADQGYDLGSLIIGCHNINEEFVREYVDELSDDDITSVCTLTGRQVVSEKFIEEFTDRIESYDLCIDRCLSKDFIRANKDKDCINWGALSTYWYFDESFLEEMKDFVVWDNIVHSSITFSDKLIIDNLDKFSHINGVNYKYGHIPEVAKKHKEIQEELDRVEAERKADLEKRMSGLTLEELISKFTERELKIATRGYAQERLVRLNNECKVVDVMDEYIRVHRASPGEPYELFLFRLYKMREHFEFFNPPKNNPDLDGQTQMEGFLKDLEKYNH